MQKADILTPWVQVDNKFRSQLSQDYSCDGISDFTGQPIANINPDPNQFVVSVVAESVVLDSVDSDNNYVILPGTREDIE